MQSGERTSFSTPTTESGSGYGAPIVGQLVQRGDQALMREDWESAENCYIAAFFCNGGRGATIKTKADMAHAIRDVVSVADYAGTRIETAKAIPAALDVILAELRNAATLLANIRRELPESVQLAQVDLKLDSLIDSALGYREEVSG